jgi:WD domain, G-beta repeat
LCALVSPRWRVLADDPWLWKRLCTVQGWQWRDPPKSRLLDFIPLVEFDDEGVGDDWTTLDVESGLAQMAIGTHAPTRLFHNYRHSNAPLPFPHTIPSFPYSASEILSSRSPLAKPDYKLLHQTHILLRNRIRHSSYRLTYLQTRDAPNSHTSTIYCLQLYTFPDLPDCSGRQVLFTGSMDRTIRQWDLSRGVVERVFEGVHEASVLSLCVRKNLVVSGDNDRRVVVWDLETGRVSKVIDDHLDSVLCVRFDDTRLVTCSKGEICSQTARYAD